uniref:Putative transcriptional regulator, LysR family n=1 Tax=Magnetococcus massalia (strain MO-1) TaxID=451514 RepID=A0A1S7LFA7_MAGMO|nr:Putative transcriptional regulator, LysR family [Candidatus Magnetococcus massalia]
MNLNHLRFALAVAKTLSFSRSAEQCCVTQPTLSNGISQLEEQLGAPLFERTTRQVTLTPFGEQMLPHIQEVLTSVTELKGAADRWFNPTHQLIRIGLSPLVPLNWLQERLARFRADNPAVEIFFKQCFVDDLATRLDNGTIDLAMLPPGPMSQRHPTSNLLEEALLFLPQDGQPSLSAQTMGAQGAVSLKQTAEAPIILTQGCGLSQWIEGLYLQQGLTMQRYPGQALSYEAAESWAELGLGATILPASRLSNDNHNALPLLLPEGPAKLPLQAVWSSHALQQGHISALKAHLDHC